jgi:hypothetical protein
MEPELDDDELDDDELEDDELVVPVEPVVVEVDDELVVVDVDVEEVVVELVESPDEPEVDEALLVISELVVWLGVSCTASPTSAPVAPRAPTADTAVVRRTRASQRSRSSAAVMHTGCGAQLRPR